MQSKHWRQFEYFNDEWRRRLSLMSSYIDNGSVVVDLGCGRQWLKEFLSRSCQYIPVDYVSRSPDTVVCDFNLYEFPNVYADVVFVSGVLEYMADVDWFIEQAANHAERKVIISYCCSNGSDGRSRRKNNWVNDISFHDVESRFKKHGMFLKSHADIDGNTIFLFSRNEKRQPYGVLIYPAAMQNLGDYTQAAAITSIVGRPEDAVYLRREDLNKYCGKPLPVICNGWFSHTPVHPPSRLLTPLYVSLHITQQARDWYGQPPMLEHMAACSPIGCRDQPTAAFLGGAGIPAYHSSCATLALGEAVALDDNGCPERNDTVYLIDPPVITPNGWVARLTALAKGALHPLLIHAAWPIASQQNSLWRQLKFAILFAGFYGPLITALGAGRVVIQTQLVPLRPGQSCCQDLFARIRADLLAFRRARAVVTGRIHVALPAAAAGAKVVFLMEKNLSCQESGRVIDHTEHFDYTFRIGETRLPTTDILAAIRACPPTEDRNRRFATISGELKKTINGFLARNGAFDHV